MSRKRRKHNNRQPDSSAAASSVTDSLTGNTEAADSFISDPDLNNTTENIAEPEKAVYDEVSETTETAVYDEALETPVADHEQESISAREEEDIFASEALSDTVPIDIDEIDREIELRGSSDPDDPMFRKSQTKADLKADASFSGFVSDAFGNIKEFVIRQKRACIIAAAALLLCIGIVALAGKLSARNTVPETISVSQDNVGELMSVSGAPLEEDAYPEVVDLIARYFAARKAGDHAALREILSNVDDMKLAQVDAINGYISDFSDIKCYTKQGPYENSYIVYATYNCTFREWEDYKAPALLALLVCTNEQGGLYIESGEIDEEAADFLKTVSAQQDVVDLFNRINTEYQEVIDSDAVFAAYMEELKPQIARDVSVRVAELRENEGNAESVSEDGTQEGDQETTGEGTTTEGGEEGDTSGDDTAGDDTQEDETQNSNTGSFMVETTTAVNVRKSDSENADRIAQVPGGTQLTCLEQRANGWSHVIYNDEDGYIKSDYVRVVGGESNNTAASNGKITVTSTVNVRGSASINGEVLGMAYAGESFELLERGAEWTKILFNGKTAYVKSDYVSN